ncbi:MAG: hypothetical protein AAGB46_01010 [Verrucomicrobiota bacterium]
MEEKRLDDEVKKYFEAQQLSGDMVAKILKQGLEEKEKGASSARKWWLTWVPVAAAAAIVMAFAFQLGQSHDQDDYTYDVAGQIAMRHESTAPLDVESASYEGVQEGLNKLGFSVTPEKKGSLLAAYEVIGARYCRLEGQSGAHMRVKNRVTGAICTLYVASLKGSLKDLEGSDAHLDLEAHEVDMWEDGGRLFALVK